MGRRKLFTKKEMDAISKIPGGDLIIGGAFIVLGIFVWHIYPIAALCIFVGTIFSILGIVDICLRTKAKSKNKREETKPAPTRTDSTPRRAAPITTTEDDGGKVEPPRPLGRYVINGHTYTAEEHIFWRDALNRIVSYTNALDYKSAHDYLINILDTKDNNKFAYDLYSLIDTSMYYMYSIRNVEGCRDALIDICLRGIQLLDGYIADVEKHTDSNCVWRFPTQLLILLEKSDRLEEAIKLCDFLASRNVKDTGCGDFLTRKAKLVRKLAKKQE